MARDLVPLTSLSATLSLLLVLMPGGMQRPTLLAGATMLAGAAIPAARAAPLAAPLDVQAGARVCLPLILHQDAGAVCYANSACDPAGYCRRPLGVCAGPGRCDRRPDACTADWAPVCGRRPDACPADWTPVCGCDGRTYSNACTAAAAGENVAYEGVCTRR